MNTATNETVSDVPFPEELAHLDDILIKLRKALEDSEADAQRHDDEYMESKRYMAQYRNEIDPKEIFQAELILRDIEHSGMLAIKEQDRYQKLVDSPYFSRIDFKGDNEKEAKTYYIGKFAFKENRRILIYDWRAPLSSMFYDCEIGKAGFDAPIGRIDGELTRKRQFKIKNSHMEYALETSMQIKDDVLQKELSSTSDEKMKTIIATLQREQNQIIRNEKSGTIVIQGVAGSGKTSIALHRVAFLLYRFKKDLTARNVIIISPNKVFGDFIANVLPELGEDPIYEMSLWDISDVQLTGVMDCEPDRDPTENADAAWCERERFKSTLEFTEELEKYIKEASDALFVPEAFTFGRFTEPAEWILGRYQAYKRYPMLERIEQITDDLCDRFIDRNIRQEVPPRRRVVQRAVRSMLKIKDTLDLYKSFYTAIGKPEYLRMPNKHTLEWADVYPFMYAHAKFAGLQKNYLIKHVVIDEMQDYTPIQYKVLNLLFQCNKTILGDFGQSVNANHLNTLEDMCSIYGGDALVELNKSYRSSYEIITFAKRISHVAKLEPVERHGPEPVLIQCENHDKLIDSVRSQIKMFLEGKDNNLGIILKNNAIAKELYDALSGEFEMNLLTPESSKFLGGITVSSIQMSKGLEFDDVIIPYADTATYHSAADRNLLYIACTRAMHRLTLIFEGGLTRLVDGWQE